MHKNPTRREWLTTAATAAAATTITPILKAVPPRPLGVQLYTVRNVFPTKGDEVLKQIAAIGYKEVEGDNFATLIRIAPTLKTLGLVETRHRNRRRGWRFRGGILKFGGRKRQRW